jgi:hypothetical protein
MTQASNVGVLTPKINSSGQLDATTGLTGAVPIANGGTGGTASPTTNGVAYGNGTAVAYTAAGTTGQVLTATTGSAPTWAAASGGGQFQTALFTSSGTWTAPSGTTQVKVIIIGGGGAGYNVSCVAYSGGFGGLAIAQCPVTGGTAYTITIGVGKTGNSGATGGTSSFGSLVSATGGTGATSGGAGSAGTGTVATGTALRTASMLISTGSLGAPFNGGVTTTSSATVFSTTQIYGAGYQGNNNSGQGGSVGGIVYLEYVG